MTKAARMALRAVAGVTVTGVAGAAVLGVQVMRAQRRRYLPAESAPAIGGQHGRAFAPPLRLAVLGDSTAAGIGAGTAAETVAVRLAAVLAGTGRFVTLDGLGVSGSRAHDLAPQVSRALIHPPDVAVVLIGANDATHVGDLDDIAEDVADAVGRLHDAGVAVVVGTCPDMGAVPAFDRPLRDVVGWLGRRVADTTRRAAEDAGAVTVDIAGATGPLFRADPVRYFSSDKFHPSGDGYALWAEALAPAVRTVAANLATAR